MFWKIAPQILGSLILVTTWLLDYKWSDGRTRRFKRTRAVLFTSIMILLAASVFSTIKDERERKEEAKRSIASQEKLAELLARNKFKDVSSDKNSPLSIECFGSANPYPAGTLLGGIDWNPRFVDVRMNLLNQGQTSLENIDLLITCDLNIAQTGQLTQITGVTISPHHDQAAFWLGGTDEKGNEITIPIPTEYTSSPTYRFFAPKLLQKERIELILAMEAVNPASNGKLPTTLFGERRPPKWLTIAGSYELREPQATRFHVQQTLLFQSKQQ